MTEHHGAEHDLLGQLLGLRFHHQHGVLGAGHDQIELGFGATVDGEVEDVFAINVADAGGADRAHERHARNGQRGGGRDHREHVRVVLHVVLQNGDDDLGLVLVAIGEERADRAIDQARGQRLGFGRAPFALEVAARDLARGEVLFLVVDGQREEVLTRLRRLGRNDGGKDHGLAERGEHGAVGLAGDLAGLKGEGLAAPVQLNFVVVEVDGHIVVFPFCRNERERGGVATPRTHPVCQPRVAPHVRLRPKIGTVPR